MSAVPITPLEPWIGRKIGTPGSQALNRTQLTRFQLTALNRTLEHVRRNSPFYRHHLANMPIAPLTCLNDLAAWPFTSAEDLGRDPLALLCVSRDRIARVVTLQTSGTTGGPKRLFFTDADMELTVDFFHHGMSTLVSPGQRVMILLPGDQPGSVGALLVKALARLSVSGRVHGPVQDPGSAVREALAAQADSLVGIPVQLLAMVCHPRAGALAGQIKTVLLTTDYVPDAITTRLQQAWGCQVFKHYGMTEMGLGGGVECGAHHGYHLREADLLVEVVDPKTLQPVPHGAAGEIVFTSLTREGMPLIRYRTGDICAFRVDSCPCGTVLKRLDTIKGRLGGSIPVGQPQALFFIGDLDEAMFGVVGVVDYSADLTAEADPDRLTLRLALRQPSRFAQTADRVRGAIRSVPAIARAIAQGRLTVAIRLADCHMPVSTGAGKRRIQDRRTRKNQP
jgi:phenylacetate-coenzyme A ligase PaaK-like adenylate-forming protein